MKRRQGLTFLLAGLVVLGSVWTATSVIRPMIDEKAAEKACGEAGIKTIESSATGATIECNR